jgi:SAM-dependent methyltransferase
VLDAACGEGYGSALLARSAASVTGVDVSAEVLEQARRRYGHATNLTFLQGDCTRRLPVADACIDLAVSFETIEHFSGQAPFVAEIARVLAPGGVFVVSSPNRSDAAPGAPPNPHHVHELDEAELRALLDARFPAQRWFAQGVDFHSVIAPFGRGAITGEVLSARNASAAEPRAMPPGAKYFLCACAADEAALARVEDRLSVLFDEEHYVLNDHRHLLAALARWNAEREQLVARLQAAEKALARLAVERNRALLALPPRE